MSSETIDHSFHKADIAQISQLLIAAGLGAGLAFGIGFPFFRDLSSTSKMLEGQAASQGLKIKDLEEKIGIIQEEKETLTSHAGILSQCIGEADYIMNNTSGAFNRVRSASGPMSVGEETWGAISSLNTLRNSWSSGPCKYAREIAGQYYAH